jgi:hypothetical protein
MKLPESSLRKFASDLDIIKKWQSKIVMTGSAIDIGLEINSLNCFKSGNSYIRYIFRVTRYKRFDTNTFKVTLKLPTLSNVSIITVTSAVLGQMSSDLFYGLDPKDISLDLRTLRITSFLPRYTDKGTVNQLAMSIASIEDLYTANIRTASWSVSVNNNQLAKDVYRLFLEEKDKSATINEDSSVVTLAVTLGRLLHLHMIDGALDKILKYDKKDKDIVRSNESSIYQNAIASMEFMGHDLSSYLKQLVYRNSNLGHDDLGKKLYNLYLKLMKISLVSKAEISSTQYNNNLVYYIRIEYADVLYEMKSKLDNKQ